MARCSPARPNGSAQIARSEAPISGPVNIRRMSSGSGKKGAAMSASFLAKPSATAWVYSIDMRRPILGVLVMLLALAAPLTIHAQQRAKRLILKDGSYQLVDKWEL